MTDRYQAHAEYLRAGRTGTEPWRVIVTTAAVVLGFLFLPPLLAQLLLTDVGYQAFLYETTRWGMTLQLLAFGVPLLVLRGMMYRLHNRGLRSILGDPDRVVTGFAQAFGAVFVLNLAMELLPPWIHPDDIAQVRPILGWLMFLPVAVCVIAVQCTAEEALFRGYLQQQFGQWSAHPLVWIGGPSALFGLAHYWNADSPAEGVLWVLWAGLLGAACADLTGRHGSLGPAIGLHLANNLFAFLLFGIQDEPSTAFALLLFAAPDLPADPVPLSDLATLGGLAEGTMLALAVLVLWLAARVGIRR